MIRAIINRDTGLLFSSDSSTDEATMLSDAYAHGVMNVEVRQVTNDELNALIIAKASVTELEDIGFLNSFNNSLGGVLAANTIAVAYPLLFIAIEEENWHDVGVLILDAKKNLTISNSQYSALKNVFSIHSIPIQLN